MKTYIKALLAVASLSAVLVTACSGDDTTIGTPRSTAATSVATTEAPETTPAPTAEATTTTELTPEFAYEIEFANEVVHDQQGIYVEAIPNNGSYPLGAKNEASPDALTMEQIMALAPGSEICLVTDGEIGSSTAKVTETGLVSYLNSATQETITFVGFRAVYLGFDNWLSAELWGVVPSPDGVTWVSNQYVSMVCPA